jgi:phosphatidylglycerol:prolipoprotein diacylglycerol transferase
MFKGFRTRLPVSRLLKEFDLPALLLNKYVVADTYFLAILFFFALKNMVGSGANTFQIGWVYLNWDGLLLVIGVTGAILLATHLARNNGNHPGYVCPLMAIVMLFSLIVARVWFVVFSWPLYQGQLDKVWVFWDGGLSVQGAIFGGLVGGVLYAWRSRLNTWLWGDFLAPGLMLVHSIGLWGNFLNNEAYGLPTDLLWGITIPCQNRIGTPPWPVETRCQVTGGFGPDTTFHPVFLYQSLWNYTCFLILLYMALNPNKPVWWERLLGWKRQWGDLLLLYFIFYSSGRFWIEGLRTDSLTFGSFRTAQVLALLAILISGELLAKRHSRD